MVVVVWRGGFTCIFVAVGGVAVRILLKMKIKQKKVTGLNFNLIGYLRSNILDHPPSRIKINVHDQIIMMLFHSLI